MKTGSFDLKYHRGVKVPKMLGSMGVPEKVNFVREKITREFLKEESVSLDIGIYRSVSSKEKAGGTFPTLLYVPGTGFISLIFPGWAGIICSKIAKNTDYQVIVLSHRLAPEHPYPLPVDDIEFLVRHIIKNSKQYKIDLNRLVLGGYSTGGYLALLVALRVRDLKSIKSLFLISPMTDLTLPITEHEEEKNKDDFPRDLAQVMISYFLGKNDKNVKDPEISPYYSKKLKSLPDRLDFFVGGHDRFRDDTERLFNKIGAFPEKTVTMRVLGEYQHCDFWFHKDFLESITKALRTDVFPQSSSVSTVESSFSMPDYKKRQPFGEPTSLVKIPYRSSVM